MTTEWLAQYRSARFTDVVVGILLIYPLILLSLLLGPDDISHYTSVLAEVHYVNSAPSDVKHRTFVLTCSELNGRFVSNEFKVRVCRSQRQVLFLLDIIQKLGEVIWNSYFYPCLLIIVFWDICCGPSL